MLTHAVEEKTSLKDLEECIESAMSKVHWSKSKKNSRSHIKTLRH